MSDIDWVVLTMGDRTSALRRAVQSLRSNDANSDGVYLVLNTAETDIEVPDGCVVVRPGRNLGVPDGRDVGLAASSAPVVGFLDDDAVLSDGAAERINAAFAARSDVGAVALRLVDEHGHTARRHVPRRGDVGAATPGEVGVFLGGACAVRRSAYLDAGGYFTDLHYGHEELELAWRLLDRGWTIEYLPDVEVFHPKSEISRHRDGWRLTGRNRVWIARRSLPVPVAALHVSAWLVLGLLRAPSGCRGSYLRGWMSGWRGDVGRAPIKWSTVKRLHRLGRAPIY